MDEEPKMNEILTDRTERDFLGSSSDYFGSETDSTRSDTRGLQSLQPLDPALGIPELARHFLQSPISR